MMHVFHRMDVHPWIKQCNCSLESKGACAALNAHCVFGRSKEDSGLNEAKKT
jgi:hypothetical protein